jgi:hypothetical protein
VAPGAGSVIVTGVPTTTSSCWVAGVVEPAGTVCVTTTGYEPTGTSPTVTVQVPSGVTVVVSERSSPTATTTVAPG